LQNYFKVYTSPRHKRTNSAYPPIKSQMILIKQFSKWPEPSELKIT